MQLQLVSKVNTSKFITDPSVSMDCILSAIKKRQINNKQQDALRTIHNKYWLVCECNTLSPAVLTVRRRNNLYYLVNISKRGHHLESCPLDYISVECESMPHKETKNFIFSNTSTEHVSSNYNKLSPPAVREAALSRLLKYLIVEAGFERIQPRNTYKSNMDTILGDACSDVYINGNPLHERIFFGLDHFYRAKQFVESKLLVNDDSPAFIIDVVDDIENENGNFQTTKYFTAKKTANFTFYKSLSSVDMSEKMSGPYIILCAISQTKDKKGNSVIAPTKCIVKAIGAKTQWVPINNEAERLAIDKIAKAILWYFDKLDVTFTAKKRLSPIKTKLGQCHPSFILELANTFAVLDMQYEAGEAYKNKKAMEYIVASSIGGGGYCELPAALPVSEAHEIIFKACSVLFKELKQCAGSKKVFSGKIKPLD